MPETQGEVTQLLHAWRVGDKNVEDRLFEFVLPELRRIAACHMRRERSDHTLQATELIGEVYARLVAAKDRDWRSRRHFFAIAARAMRRYLIDYARATPTAAFVDLEICEPLIPHTRAGKIELCIAVGSLLDELAEIEPDWCTVVELKFYMGLTDTETAETMGLSLRTVQREWQDARRWLFEKWGSR